MDKNKIDKKAIGKRIRNIRINNGYTSQEFGTLIDGSSKSSVSGWENGFNLPNKARLLKIAEIGNCTIDELLYGSFEEYVVSTLKSILGIELKTPFLYYFIDRLKKKNITYGEDTKIYFEYRDLGVLPDKLGLRPLIYQPIYLMHSEYPIYTAYFSGSEQEILFFLYADIQKNLLHIIPNFMLDTTINYTNTIIGNLKNPEKLIIFLKNIYELGFKNTAISIISYTIEYLSDHNGTVTRYTPKENITYLEFSVDEQCFIENSVHKSDYKIFEPFRKELIKEILYQRTYNNI
ncbi:helix-turn-helix transcriptional regulator [Mediterraneibacter sp. NSJ-55]|uniref:Helix-turn-helix transcriptional regulator n=1 Tax=Mediterraneibacter hominis TaxID=2763054 RepID=A0A923LJK2_9FIRM|nr:helix-turn-helix transcriptional regulator [Mediterraneibacter hominis]MBC5689262.1 helix-turn-helix transcriptional regulator [Mediterraneibacter hominis]